MARERRCDFHCFWEDCGKAFRRRSNLRRHHRIHTNERPYGCTFKDCNKNFIQRSALTVHSRTHTGEKPHICGHKGCYKAFSDSSSLARHRRIHTGLRPYLCQEPMCQRSVCRKSTLIRHQCRSHPPRSYELHAVRRHISGRVLPAALYCLSPRPVPALPAAHYLSTWAPTVHEFYSTQPIVTHKIPVSSAPVDMQQYIQLAQQQSASTHPVFVSLGPQRTFQAGVPPVECHTPMVTLAYDSPYKEQIRLLNHPEGIDWGFFGDQLTMLK